MSLQFIFLIDGAPDIHISLFFININIIYL